MQSPGPLHDRLASRGPDPPYQIPRVLRSTGVVGCGFLERPRHAHCCHQARVLAGRRGNCDRGASAQSVLSSPREVPRPNAATPALDHTTFPPPSPPAKQSNPLFLFLLHLPFEQQLLGRVGNTSFRSKAAVIANSLPSARRVACLSRPRNTPSPSCPSSTPKPSRIRSTPPLPHLPGAAPTNDNTTTTRNQPSPRRLFAGPQSSPLIVYHLPIMTINDSGVNVDKTPTMANSSSSPNGSSGSPVTPPTANITPTTAGAAEETGMRH